MSLRITCNTARAQSMYLQVLRGDSTFSHAEVALIKSAYCFLTGESCAPHSKGHTMPRKWCGMPLRTRSCMQPSHTVSLIRLHHEHTYPDNRVLLLPEVLPVVGHSAPHRPRVLLPIITSPLLTRTGPCNLRITSMPRNASYIQLDANYGTEIFTDGLDDNERCS